VPRAVAAQILEVDRVVEEAVAGPVASRVAELERMRRDGEAAADEPEHLRHEREPARRCVVVEGREDLLRRAHLDDLPDAQTRTVALM